MFQRTKKLKKLLLNNNRKLSFGNVFSSSEHPKNTSDESENSVKRSEQVSDNENNHKNSNIPFVTIKELFDSKNISHIEYFNYQSMGYNNIKHAIKFSIKYKHYNFESKAEYSADSVKELWLKIIDHFSSSNNKN